MEVEKVDVNVDGKPRQRVKRVKKQPQPKKEKLKMDAKKAKVEKDLAQENKAAERLAAKVRNEKVGPKPGREAKKGHPKPEEAIPKDKPKGEVILKSQFDHPLNTQGGLIDNLLGKGEKRETIVLELAKFAGKDEKWAMGRLSGHLKHLVEDHKAKIDLEVKEKKEPRPAAGK